MTVPAPVDALRSRCPRRASDRRCPTTCSRSSSAADYLPADQRAAAAPRLGGRRRRARRARPRKSGEPYITHPVAVATVLAEQRLDVETLVAAILHDTHRGHAARRASRIASEFGETVAELVDGVTKLDKLQFADRQEAAAESFRKMLLAMARDLRVILIKLADRLHNMRTLGAQSRRGAHAHRARDAGDLRADRAAPGHEPDQGRAAGPRLPRAASAGATRCSKSASAPQPLVRREALAKIEAQLAQRLTKEGLHYRLVGRVKSPWSIYTQDARRRTRRFDQVMDVFGFRIVVRIGRRSATTRSAWCMRCSSRWTGASATSSRSPRPTATSRCTRCCSGRTARRSKCRSAPRRWT